MKNYRQLIYNRALNYSKFDINMTEFANENKINSPTDYLIITSTKNKLTYIYKKQNNLWELLHKWTCTVGKPSTPSPKGVFSVGVKYPAIVEGDTLAKYAINITDDYYYHSILYDGKGLYVKDGRLGVAISHGCIRLATENAQWMYDNVPEGSTIVIN